MITRSLIQRLGMVQVVIIITTSVLTLIHVLEPARSPATSAGMEKDP